MDELKDGPGLKVPPPVYYLLALLAGLGMERLYPVALNLSGPGVYLGWSLIILSLFIVISAMVLFKRAETPFDVREGASSLVTGGIMNVSRNPGYLALTLFYVGIAVLLGNGWMLGLLVPVLLIMNVHVIRREEMHLQAMFADEYMEYKARVRRWI